MTERHKPTKLRLGIERLRQKEVVADLVDPFVDDGAAALALDMWSITTDRWLIGLGAFDVIIAVEVHAVSECKQFADTEMGVVRLGCSADIPLRPRA